MPEFKLPTGPELWDFIHQLAEQRDQSWRFTKKGDRRPIEDVEAQKAARKRNTLARQRTAYERVLAEQAERNRRRPSADGSIAERMLKAMEPGKWYGMGDLARMAGADRSARGKVHQVLRRKGLVERARNPEWTGEKADPWLIMGGSVEPQPEWLYRLTDAGIVKREGLLRA